MGAIFLIALMGLPEIAKSGEFNQKKMSRTYKIWAVVAIVYAFVLGFSRLYVGVHYPTDVFVGWLLGIATIAAVSFIRSKIRNSLVLYTVLFMTAVPGLFFCKTTDYYSSFGLMTGAIWGFYFEEKVVHFQNTRSIIR